SAVVAVGPVSSATALPRAADLSTRIATCLARALGQGARALGGAPALEQARTAAGGARTLVFVLPELAQGRLRTPVATYAITPDRTRTGTPAPSGRAEATCALDGE